ncbi:DUF2842 domain-containing protein [Microvirga sp. W0021]|uniref:DUF2842 domain-containing protein n=1 Tax=Hohaiivirga grylli TaxID=3133970 RepID=A0ABV0BI95_9HYPH
MKRRTRKLLGTIIILIYAIIYALLAMALADSRISEEGLVIKIIFYIVIGLAWILPLMPLIKWMERPDKT